MENNIFVPEKFSSMKKLLLTTCSCLVLAALHAQTQVPLDLSTASSTKVTTAPLDKSPLDMAYFPSDYPMLKTQSKLNTPPLARLIYSRPQRENRTVFGGLVEYGKVWRLGANEATEIEFFRDATVGGKKLAKGRYTIYAIPAETKWTIILNKDTDSWGAFVYDEKKDVVRTDVPVRTLETPVDAFSASFTKGENSTSLVFAWEQTSVSLPIQFGAAPAPPAAAKSKK